MLTVHDKFLKQAGGLFMPLWLAMVFCAGLVLNVHAQLPPPNDNLANAQGIIGANGSVYGTNFYATAETDEVSGFFYPDGINPPQHSIWYIWTAPYSTKINFNTSGSTDTNGNPLATALAVYQLIGPPLTYADLSGALVNDTTNLNGEVTSAVDVDVTLGTQYLIQVDGSTNNAVNGQPDGTNATGIIVLNWSPSVAAGTFNFSSAVYAVGAFDDDWVGLIDTVVLNTSLTTPLDGGPGTGGGGAGARITVTRTGSFNGRCEVTCYLTNGWYTNVYWTNYTGTNIYFTNYDGLGNVIGWTNTFFTNIASENFVQNDEQGNYVYLPALAYYQTKQTNDIGGPSVGNGFEQIVFDTPTMAGLGLGNGLDTNNPDFFTNFYPFPINTFTFPFNVSFLPFNNTNAITNISSTATNIFVTNVFSSNYSITVVTPAAPSGFIPYFTNLTFDDFQMSQDFYVGLNANSLGGDSLGAFGPDFPDTNGDNTYLGINSQVILILTNAVPDLEEDPDIVPPTISVSAGTAELNVLSFFSDPNNYNTDATTQRIHTNNSVFGTLVSDGGLVQEGMVSFNWERATFRVNKDIGTANSSYYVYMFGNLPAGATYKLNYVVGIGPNGPLDNNQFETVAGSDYALPNLAGFTDFDFSAPTPGTANNNISGTLTFTAGGNPWAGITIPINNNPVRNFDADIYLQLTGAGPPSPSPSPAPPTGIAYIGNVANANVTINYGVKPGGSPVFNAPPAGGCVDINYNPDSAAGSSEPTNNSIPGANQTVQAVAMQANGLAVIGGAFTAYNSISNFGVVRLLNTGLKDPSFNPNGTGVNYLGDVTAIAIDGNQRIIIGGSFTSYNGTNAINIARLNTDGSLDTNFNTGIGFNNPVYALAVDSGGNILVGGDFTSYNTTNCNYIARLLPTGALDPSFVPDTGNGRANYGADNDVESLALDGRGNIVLGGKFNYVNGSNMNYLARLLPSGALDPSFAPEIGPDDVVYSVAVALNNNNEILIGGAFQNYNLVSRSSVALIANNGALDTGFTPGTGADNTIYTTLIQPDGNFLIGGQFRNYNGTRRMGMARLLPQGWLDTSFLDPAYNQYAGFYAPYYNAPNQTAFAFGYENATGNIIVGGAFTKVGGGAHRTSVYSRWNIARLIGPGTTTTDRGGIGNDPGNMTLVLSNYTVDDVAGALYVTLDRVNGSLGPTQLTLGTNTLPPGPGAATAADFGLNPSKSVATYHDIWDFAAFGAAFPPGVYGWKVSDGFYGFNYNIQPSAYGNKGDADLSLTINNDPTALQDLFASLSLLDLGSHDLLQLGGVVIPTRPALGLPGAQLQIVNDDFPPGVFGFSVTNYTTVNTSNKVVVSVLRTNGNAGYVELHYYTRNGTAISNSFGTVNDYAQATGTLIFEPGVTSNGFTVTIENHSTVEPTKRFNVYLWNAFLNTGNGLTPYTNAFAPGAYPYLTTNATVTIVDGNFAPGHLSFTNANYTVSKGGWATVGVQRLGGALGQLTVQCGTANGTAINGTNYTGVTNTLTWGNQDTGVKTMLIHALQDGSVDGPTTVNLNLFNATNIGNTANDSLILASPSTAVLTIQEVNNYGALSFVVPNFNILQNAGQAVITVVRTGGTTGQLTVNYTTATDANVSPLQQAVAGSNYVAVSGTLTFNSGQTSTNFIVPIIYTPNETNATNRVVNLVLLSGNAAASVQTTFPITNTLTILDPQLVISAAGSVDPTTQNGTGFNGFVNSLALQPDGSLLAGGDFTFFNDYPFNYVARLIPDGNFDTSFLFDEAGANGSVLQVLEQTTNLSEVNDAPVQTNDSSIVIVGGFTTVDGVNRSGIARFNLSGSLDETFNPGSGADSTIFAIAETLLDPAIVGQPQSVAYYIGGNFANYDGVPCGGIVRLNASTNSSGYPGSVDPNFNVGQGVTSSSGSIRALAVQADGSVIAGGEFTAFNGAPYDHLVRISPAGVVDSSFQPIVGSNPSDSVRAVLVQPDGQILVGGIFTNVNGSNYNYLVRLIGTNGSLDPTFNVGVGANNSVLALALDSQQRILVGGEFTTFSGVTRSGITRLNPDGTVDPTINFGAGANGGFVGTIVVDANDEIDVGGGFTTFENNPENNFVRLYGGATSGNGEIQFAQAIYGVMENGTNAAITLQRIGGEGTNVATTVSITFSTADDTAIAGTNYTAVTTNVTFPYGETYATILVPILNSNVVSSNTIVYLNLSNPTNTTIGPIASALLYITNANSAVRFSAATYRDSEDVPGGYAIIPVERLGNPNTTVSVTVYTGTNGTATSNVNYIPNSTNLTFYPGVTNLDFTVPLLNATNMFGDLTVDLEMDNATNTITISPDSAILTIASVFTGPGVLLFSQTNYSVSEGATNVTINIIRTNGSTGTVSVVLTTSNGTAIAGQNYLPVNGTIVFPDGVTNESTNITVIQQPLAGPDTTVYLTLSDPQPPAGQGGPGIGGINPVILTITNDIPYFTFTNLPYVVNEGAGIFNLDIVGGGPITNGATIDYYTIPPSNGQTEATGYALPNIDYVPVSGVFTYHPNATQYIPITIIQGTALNGPLTFQVGLSNASPGVQTNGPDPVSVTIISDVTGFQFATNAYVVPENGSNITINVTRINAGSQSASVRYLISDGTNQNPALNAVNGVDYLGTNGRLFFSGGQTNASFNVTILNPNMVENSKTFNLALANPLVGVSNTTAFLVAPSNATVTITDTLAGVSFEGTTFPVSECAGEAVIPVILTGVTNNPVIVNYGTADGSGIAGTNYVATSGSLTFLPGQTLMYITVPVINNHIIGPNHTVYLTLSNAQNAVLLNPSTIILNIQECNGAYIVQSGTSFVSGNLEPSGIVLPNETVTILFGLRDVAGFNTTNLVATLLATTNIVPIPSGESQYYGRLITNGPTVARAFTFTALGSNGEYISANLALQDGSQVYTNVDFSIALGGATTVFSTNETLFLYGSNNPPSKAFNSNPPNFGYPSVINVSGVIGNITEVTVSMPDLFHSYAEDVALVLTGPSGQPTYLMADCGGGQAAPNVSLTFSQSASSSLPESTAITSGTYLPTAYAAPRVPAPGPSPPYTTSLTNFLGESPNGAWSLWAADEEELNSGYISNGWSLNISTGIAVESDADLEVSINTSPANATQGNMLTYVISVTNYGPSVATNVVLTDMLPAGVTYEGCSCTTGSNYVLTNIVGTLAVSNGVSFTNIIIPNALGYITNIAAAVSSQPDPNSNNVQTNIMLVSPQSADVGVTLNGNPNPVLNSNNVTYTIIVTNGGPSPATGVTAIDVLPAGFTPIANGITATQGTFSATNGTVTWNVGTLGVINANFSATLTIVANVNLPTNTLPATSLDSITVGSLVYDPYKVNNYAAFKTVVVAMLPPAAAPGIGAGAGAGASSAPLVLTPAIRGTNYTLSWPVAGAGVVLQGSVILPPTWVVIPNSSLTSLLIGGQTNNVYVLPGTNGYHFFRLATQQP